jgi:hypothetical protein
LKTGPIHHGINCWEYKLGAAAPTGAKFRKPGTPEMPIDNVDLRFRRLTIHIDRVTAAVVLTVLGSIQYPTETYRSREGYGEEDTRAV